MSIEDDTDMPAFTVDAKACTFMVDKKTADYMIIEDEIPDHQQFYFDHFNDVWQIGAEPFYLDGKIGMSMTIEYEDRSFDYVINIPPGPMKLLLRTKMMVIARQIGQTHVGDKPAPLFEVLLFLPVHPEILNQLRDFVPLAMQDAADKINEKIRRGN